MPRTALITGGNRGIGQQLALVLATDGWDVLIGSRDIAKGKSAAARLRKVGGRARAIGLDVTSDASVENAARVLRDGAIRIDALVNNAGIYGGDSRGPEGVARTIETNFFGPLRVTLGLLELLRDGATITNVTSGLGELSNLDDAHAQLLADPKLEREALVDAIRGFVAGGGKAWGTPAYGVSKAALNALSRVLAKELAPRGIRVNSTCPGWVRTDMGGRGAPRSVEEGAASVLFGVTTTETGGVFRDGKKIPP